MLCPKCHDTSMYDMDDNGGGWSGWECPVCGAQVIDADLPCPNDPEGEPCLFVDNEWGGSECISCGRPEPF